jgi:hypothetical protein
MRSEVSEAAVRSLDGELFNENKPEKEKNLGALFL